jgi:hypothetical protein
VENEFWGQPFPDAAALAIVISPGETPRLRSPMFCAGLLSKGIAAANTGRRNRGERYMMKIDRVGKSNELHRNWLIEECLKERKGSPIEA